MSLQTYVRYVQTKFSLKQTRTKTKIAVYSLLMYIVYYAYQIYNDKELLFFKNPGRTTPCILPELDPFDKKMMEYVWKQDPLVCDTPPVVFVDMNNTLQYNLTAMTLINESPDTVKCEVYYIDRVFDSSITFRDPFPWKPPKQLTEDFFRIKCKGNSGELFDNTLTRIQKSDKQFRDLKESLSEDKYNLLMFGIDSLSRSSAIRQLPKTYNYLKYIDGYDMKGFMKVADNTFVNLVPLLSGYYVEEIKLDFVNEYADSVPLLWRNFTENQAATLYNEDIPNLNTFNIDKVGFKDKPTDHYMRPFWLGKVKLMPMHNLRAHVSRFLEHSKMKLSKISALCLADKPNHVVIMDYIKRFMHTYKDTHKFSFSFLTELAHEFQNLIQLGDDDIMQFFKWLKDEGYLKNTILIVFSDHGLKFGNNQHLFVARMENRLPFLSIVLPESLKRKYPDVDKNLRTNQERLTTAFDLHATLRDILHGHYYNPGQFHFNNKLRGISMFKEIPEDRSCADANIGEEFCACYKSTRINITNNPLADKIGHAVLKHINLIIKDNHVCSLVKLNAIIEIRKLEQGLKFAGRWRRKNLWIRSKSMIAEEREDRRHVVVLETLPGHARFYATCDVHPASVEVIGNVDRINKYGNQSHCVQYHELRPFCYCNDLL